MLAETKAFNSFAVDDVEAAKSFYEGTLGLEVDVLDAEHGLLMLKLAGGRDTFVYRKPDFEPATYTVLNFEVTDIDSVVDDLAARGVSFERVEGFEQDENRITEGNGGPRIAWFRDPAGNILSVLEQQ